MNTFAKYSYPIIDKDSVIFCFSILVCTYNPEEQVFSRTLKSVESLKIPEGVSVECIIVDNNSKTPIEPLPYLQEFLKNCSWAKVIQEPTQGLTFARIAGFQAAKNSFIVFVDDDNEVSSSYLEVLLDLFVKYPSVGAWGPGNVHVEFMGGVSDWFSSNFKHIFQERHIRYNEYGCVPETWTSFYPIGTGLAVRREILDQYCTEVKNGNLSSSDRKGKSLSSGGDIQIVWEAIKMGYAAGISPSLEVKHIIPSNRSNLDYVKRLSFGAAASYQPCLNSSFPEVKYLTITSTPRSTSIVREILKKIIKRFIRFEFRLLIIDLAIYLGDVSGYYQVIQKSSTILDFMIQRLKLK
jgi:glycosyltransferase involved in cell wall biosynthesis